MISHKVHLTPRDGEKWITTDQVVRWVAELRTAGDHGDGIWHAVTGWGGKIKRLDVEIIVPDDQPVYADLGNWDGPPADPRPAGPLRWQDQPPYGVGEGQGVAGWHPDRG